MRTIARLIPVALIGVIAMTAAAAAADKPKPPEPGKAVPDATPLTVTVEGTAKYPLPADAKSEDEMKKGFATDQFPPPPKIDLKLVVKNTSADTVKVWEGGDPVTIDLTVKGDGVVSVPPRLAMTTEFRTPKVVELAAGKSFEIPLKQLSGGMRGAGHYVYWTKPGEHTLSATLNTAMWPPPKGADRRGEFGVVHVASKEFKITVEKK
jgi:hypothetical protein